MAPHLFSFSSILSLLLLVPVDFCTADTETSATAKIAGVVRYGSDSTETTSRRVRCSGLAHGLLLDTVADFDGDGADEALSILQGTERLSLVKLAGDECRTIEWGDGAVLLRCESIATGDLNSDGKDDIACSMEGLPRLLLGTSRQSPGFELATLEIDVNRDRGGIVDIALPRNDARVSEMLVAVSEPRQLYYPLRDRHPAPLIASTQEVSSNPSFIARSVLPFSSLLGYGEVDGHPGDELITAGVTPSSWTYTPRDPDGGALQPKLWTQIPGKMQSAVFGDFNGDGLLDAVLRSDRLYGWWGAFSGPDGPFLAPLRNLLDRNAHLVGKGDVDNDGVDEIISALDGALEIVSFVRGAPVSDVQILQDGKVAAITGPDGRFVIADPTLSPLSFKRAEHQFFPGKILLPRSRVRTLSILARSPLNIRNDASRWGFTAPAAGPYVCLGYNPAAIHDRWFSGPEHCPSGHAVFEVDDSAFTEANFFRFTCCPLPANDILSGETVTVANRCPDNFVVTGISGSMNQSKTIQELVCTKIDTNKYVLADPRPGAYWGKGYSAPRRGAVASRESLPAAVRSGVARSSLEHWDVDGCLGAPLGSLWIGGPAKDCADTRFRALRYRAGSTPDQAVQMIPSCERMDRILDPRSGCSVGGADPVARSPGP